MEWDEIENTFASSKQRRAIHKFVSGDHDAVADLLRFLSVSEADAILKALIGANKRQQDEMKKVCFPSESPFNASSVAS